MAIFIGASLFATWRINGRSSFPEDEKRQSCPKTHGATPSPVVISLLGFVHPSSQISIVLLRLNSVFALTVTSFGGVSPLGNQLPPVITFRPFREGGTATIEG